MFPSVERTQAKRQKLEHRICADSVLQRSPPGYEYSCHPGSLFASAALKRKNWPPPALSEDDFDSCGYSFKANFRSVSMPKKYKANLFFSVEEIEIPTELVCCRGAYQYGKERSLEGQDDLSI